MPFFNLTWRFPWQSFLIVEQEVMVTLRIAPNPSRMKNFFIKFVCTDDEMLVYQKTDQVKLVHQGVKRIGKTFIA